MKSPVNTITVPRRTITWEQKCDLARDAVHAAMETRFGLGMVLEEPLCAYAACEKLDVLVRFVDVNMEGVYLRQERPRIFLSVHRPLGRRHFNCAHELGHHVFGHGATLDELREDAEAYNDRHPDEFLADVFAGHLLMPVLGIRQAFSRRGIKTEELEPKDILAVATEFGVGYEALLTQLTFALKDITAGRRKDLLRARPGFRRTIFEKASGADVVLVDSQFTAPTLDVEVNHLIVAPEGSVAADDIVLPTGNSPLGPIFRADRRGIAELSVPGAPRALTVRVAPERFTGLAKFRHLEDDE